MLLLHEPEADVAIVHDDEWCDLLPNNFAVDPRRLKIKDFLENVAKSRISTMNQHGCVSLKKPDCSDDSQTDIPARASSELLPSRSQGEIIDNLDQARYLLTHDMA
ncbi:hypothetical protein M378DRAFT_167002 [Amanita muscaria Koide BX008]|uniref:Uncharacterized protein n=1 Tax=Amanita muscaria (strain Koide BX008) TaxID=946122 RepID=A0A0C2SE71_AMAMK|nr:hypothetical protein M378DRAFT_167002 [Amanita muscaria Koide BX008]